MTAANSALITHADAAANALQAIVSSSLGKTFGSRELVLCADAGDLFAQSVADTEGMPEAIS